VEQRNWTHVRKEVGYRRLDTTAELDLLRRLYGQLRLYKNFFQPAMKLKHSAGDGSLPLSEREVDSEERADAIRSWTHSLPRPSTSRAWCR
jgi:hypothetical protein